jgi:hypothetical protein
MAYKIKWSENLSGVQLDTSPRIAFSSRVKASGLKARCVTKAAASSINAA